MRTRDLGRLHENCYFSHETGPVVFSHQGKINELIEGMGKMKSDISGEIQGVHARMGKMESGIEELKQMIMSLHNKDNQEQMFTQADASHCNSEMELANKQSSSTHLTTDAPTDLDAAQKLTHSAKQPQATQQPTPQSSTPTEETTHVDAILQPTPSPKQPQATEQPTPQSSIPQGFAMAETKLFLCFEAINTKEESVYLIHSTKVSDLFGRGRPRSFRPVFTKEEIISGVSDMGCGLFNSKIILAGGVSVTGEEMTYNHGLVTYDTTTKKVAHEDFPNMRGRKVRPLVFEVSGRLYVLDTSNSAYKRSWEVFYPTPKVWARVSDRYCTMYNSLSGTKSNISGRTPYSWFICGPAFSISLPMDDLPYFHHARQLVKGFLCNSSQPLPFHGMAITYWNQGFSDVVVISFSQGLVAGQGRVEGRLLGYTPFHLIKPQFIFKTDCYEKPDGEVSSYFADWGNGKFCLTTFDNVNIHVYVFKLLRQEHADGTTSFVLKDLDNHKYTFNDFSVGGCTSVRLCGCFVLVSDRYCTMYNSLSGTKSNISGRTPYSWFICGPAFSISLPMDDLPYFHHARQLVKGFLCNSSQPLPFHGMAITYWNQGFSDVVVISFSQGLVAGQGRVEGRLLGYTPFHLIKPQFIFKTDCYEKPDGEVSSYFADWGNGKFCLTTFDNVNIHVYVFKLLRQEHADGTTSFVLKDLDNHKYTFNDFSVGGCTSVRLCGCFVLVSDRYCTMYNSLSGTKSNISGRTPYSWFICGPAFSISLPMDDLPYFHHARQLVKGFLCNSSQPLPFHGMAITYWNQGFSDVVVISFSQGLVAGQGRVEGRLLGYTPFHLIKPQFIFKTDCYEKPDGEVSSYFADWGNGKFCLTTFDNVNIHVYVFKLLRQEHADGTTSFVLKDLDNHKYTFNDFSVGGCTSVRLCGCFVLPNDDEAKRSEESKVYKNYFSCFEFEGEDDDIPPLIQVGGEYKIDPDYDTDGPCSDLFQ